VLLFSDETFAELASRLLRPKFDRYVVQATRQQFLADLAGVAEWVTITGIVHVCRDPDHDKFLETAITAKPTASSPAMPTFGPSIRSMVCGS
jgi:putative PIN family toxin of toxin-antitoxin system